MCANVVRPVCFLEKLRQIAPDLTLVDIPNDDRLYQEPFEFPNGAPPVFHHGNEAAKTRGLGLRHNGRLVVFYHPGDMGDAWRNDHAGMEARDYNEVFKMGLNVMNYAFNTYTDLHPAK